MAAASFIAAFPDQMRRLPASRIDPLWHMYVLLSCFGALSDLQSPSEKVLRQPIEPRKHVAGCADHGERFEHRASSTEGRRHNRTRRRTSERTESEALKIPPGEGTTAASHS